MEASAFCRIVFYVFVCVCVRACGMKSLDAEDERARAAEN